MPFDSLKLHGKNYTKGELELLVQEKLQSRKIKEYERAMYSFIREWISGSDVVKVQTSGTTGNAKLIEIKKKRMIESAKMTCGYFHLTADSNLLLCLSADYIAGKMMVVRAFVSGANLVAIEPGGNPLRRLRKKINFSAMVPLQVENILSNPVTKRKFQSIENVIIGGAAVSYKLEQAISKCRNNIYSTFAMTETLSHIALKKLNGEKKSSLFDLLEGIKIATDERGCMIVKAPKLNDDPVVTNDIIEIVDDKHFRWLGRYDNVINSGGIKMYPEKIEEKIAGILTENRYFIASLPDEKLGEKVVLVIEDIMGTRLKEIKRRVEKALGKYEKPREYIVVKKFKETANGKVQRMKTLEMAPLISSKGRP